MISILENGIKDAETTIAKATFRKNDESESTIIKNTAFIENSTNFINKLKAAKNELRIELGYIQPPPSLV